MSALVSIYDLPKGNNLNRRQKINIELHALNSAYSTLVKFEKLGRYTVFLLTLESWARINRVRQAIVIDIL